MEGGTGGLCIILENPYVVRQKGGRVFLFRGTRPCTKFIIASLPPPLLSMDPGMSRPFSTSHHEYICSACPLTLFLSCSRAGKPSDAA